MKKKTFCTFGVFVPMLLVLVVMFTSCQHNPKFTSAPQKPEYLGIRPASFISEVSEEEYEKTRALFEGQFYISKIIRTGPERIVLAAFWEDTLSVYDFDLVADSCIEVFHIEALNDEESEFKTITETANGYALTTNRRILLLDRFFNQTREIVLPVLNGDYIWYATVSPDGKQVAYCDIFGLHVSDIDFTSGTLIVASKRGGAAIYDEAPVFPAWDRDGLRIRYSYCSIDSLLAEGVVDRDGKNNSLNYANQNEFLAAA